MTVNIKKSAIVMSVVIFFFTAKIIDGPVRYYLDNMGLVLLTYVPTITLLILSLSFLLLETHVPFKLYAFILFFFFIGLIYVGNIFQVLFGIYLFTPFISGFALYKYLSNKYLYVIIWTITTTGIIINYFVPFTWEGYSYSVGDVDIVANLKWLTKDKVERLSGFCRASYEAAIFIVFSGTYLIIKSNRLLIKIFIWLISGICIFLTTTKGIIMAFLIVTLFLLFNWYEKKTGRYIVLILLFVGLYFPISTLFIKYSIDINSDLSLILFASFEDRLLTSWPDVFKIVFERGSFIFGRGFGGIGTPMFYFEPNNNLWIYPDNGYLDIYATFGFLGLVIMIIYPYKILTINKEKYISSFVIIIIVFAITNNFISDPFIGFFIGGLLRLTKLTTFSFMKGNLMKI